MGWRRENFDEKHGNLGNFPHFKQEIQVLSLHQMLFRVVCPSSVSLEKKNCKYLLCGDSNLSWGLPLQQVGEVWRHGECREFPMGKRQGKHCSSKGKVWAVAAGAGKFSQMPQVSRAYGHSS